MGAQMFLRGGVSSRVSAKVDGMEVSGGCWILCSCFLVLMLPATLFAFNKYDLALGEFGVSPRAVDSAHATAGVSAQGARHQGRYGSAGTAMPRYRGRARRRPLQLACAWVVLLVTTQFALCSPSFVFRPRVLGITAGMAQKDSYTARRPRPFVVSGMACARLVLLVLRSSSISAVACSQLVLL